MKDKTPVTVELKYRGETSGGKSWVYKQYLGLAGEKFVCLPKSLVTIEKGEKLHAVTMPAWLCDDRGLR